MTLPMPRIFRVCVSAGLAGLLWVAGISLGEDSATEGGSPAGGNRGSEDHGQRLADRGEYIVHHVAMCVYCHTPRDQRGQLQQIRLLQGGRIPFPSPYAGQRWAVAAPKLAGLPAGWREGELGRFLQTGETTGSRPPRPPMPPYRMTSQDAQAVAAYLKSL